MTVFLLGWSNALCSTGNFSTDSAAAPVDTATVFSDSSTVPFSDDSLNTVSLDRNENTAADSAYVSAQCIDTATKTADAPGIDSSIPGAHANGKDSLSSVKTSKAPRAFARNPDRFLAFHSYRKKVALTGSLVSLGGLAVQYGFLLPYGRRHGPNAMATEDDFALLSPQLLSFCMRAVGGYLSCQSGYLVGNSYRHNVGAAPIVNYSLLLYGAGAGMACAALLLDGKNYLLNNSLESEITPRIGYAYDLVWLCSNVWSLFYIRTLGAYAGRMKSADRVSVVPAVSWGNGPGVHLRMTIH